MIERPTHGQDQEASDPLDCCFARLPPAPPGDAKACSEQARAHDHQRPTGGFGDGGGRGCHGAEQVAVFRGDGIEISRLHRAALRVGKIELEIRTDLNPVQQAAARLNSDKNKRISTEFIGLLIGHGRRKGRAVKGDAGGGWGTERATNRVGRIRFLGKIDVRQGEIARVDRERTLDRADAGAAFLVSWIEIHVDVIGY
jgi:hypothetical protein